MWLIGPAFLWALAAVGVPLWLHLTQRRKYKEMPVGTLRFLREVLRRRRRRARLEEILLLILRIAAVALLAFVFTRPVWPGAGRGNAAAEDTIVLLDASGSMTPEMAKAARSAAEKEIGAAASRGVVLAQFADKVETIASPSEYRPRPGAPTDIQRALDWAVDRLRTQGRDAGRIVLIGHLAQEALPAKPPRVWPPQYEVQLVPIAPPTLENAAVRQVALLTPFVAGEMELEARVSVPENFPDRRVTIEADGASKSVTLPPGAERVVFRLPPPKRGLSGWVSVSGKDSWPVDNRRPFVAQWTEPSRILLVDGRPGATPFDGQAYFIRQALEASGAAHGKSPFLPEVVYDLEGKNGVADLSKVDAVALCGVTEVSPDVAESLAKFVGRGGGLIVLLDERWTPGATAELAAAGLFPGSVKLTGGTKILHPSKWDASHPALAGFDKGGGDLRDLDFRDAFEMRAGSGWRSVLEIGGGHSILLEKEASEKGAGRVIVCAHPLTRAWTDLAVEPLFVPLTRNLFASVARPSVRTQAAKATEPGLSETRAPGIYESKPGAAEVVAPDSSESLVKPAELPAFRAAFGLPDPGKMPPAPAAHPALEASAPDREQRGEWWPWLAVALCVVLMIENLVATRPRIVTSVPV